MDKMKPLKICTGCPFNEDGSYIDRQGKNIKARSCNYNVMSPGNIINNEPEHFLCPLEYRKPKRKKKVRTDLPIEETLYNRDWMYAQYITNEMETAKIAELVNRTGCNVVRWLNKHGIKIRNRTENMRLFMARKRRNREIT